MKRYSVFFAVLLLCGAMLMACSDDNNESSDNGDDNVGNNENQTENGDGDVDIPEDVIKDADSDPIELENQMELDIGEKGYTVTSLTNGEVPMAVTLNGVEKEQTVGDGNIEMDGDEFYMIGDFTFENLGDDSFKVEFPDATKGSEKEEVENDELGNNGDLLGIGFWFVDDDNMIDSDDNPTNTLSIEPGEEKSHKIALEMRGSTDEYMMVFGFFDGNNEYYKNKVAWMFGPDALEE